MLALVLSVVVSQVAIDRETPEAAPNTKYYFSSRTKQEAARFGWKKLAVAFRGFESQRPGTVPVYCDTLELAEHSTYRFVIGEPAPGWKHLFVSFYAYPEPTPGAVPVNEESMNGQFNYATRGAVEAAQYGWAQQRVAFWALAPH